MSRQLRNLLKQNRLLEEKIFYEPRETDWRTQLIGSHELSQALSCLANRIIESTSSQLSVLKMINDVENVSKRPLPAFEKNALQVVEIIFNYLRENTYFDSKYYHVLNSLQLAFTRLSLNDLSFLDNNKHASIRFLNKLLNVGYHFDQNAGKLAQYFIHAIELLVDRLANRDQVTSNTFIMADKMLDEYFESFNDKVTDNTNIILAQMNKDLRQEEANQFTMQLIKSKTQGEEMPIFLLDFFENHLSPILHQTIEKYGVNSKQCQQLLTDMDTISWSITCPYGDTTYQHRFEADVTDAMKRVYGLLENAGAINDYIKDFFIETESFHGKKLRGERVNYDVMISADIFADEEYENDDIVRWYDEPAQMFFDIETLKESHWYYLIHEDQKIRSQLLARNPVSKEFIFVNLSGELVAKISFNDTEYLAKNLTPIDTEGKTEYKHALSALVRELKARLEILKNEYQLFLTQKAKDREAQEKQEALAREAVQKQIEEEQQLQMLKRQEEIRLEAEKQAEARRLEELNAKQRFKLKGIYRQLTPGAQVAYQADNGRWTEISLMLISKTTQRHIFTDSKGQKIIEPTKDEVLDLISQERLKVIRQAGPKNDPLSALVKQRRQKLSQM
ncbi:DUF1631 family protein [Aliikangiella sp. IMCC44359]|uniref:DUF1631 family protein n=1 Tax=Aliikangiella sp. IMCC44359 TaxID=3459125 RepID=UPI00403AD045